MKFKKTPLHKRSIYTYTFYDEKGEKQSVTLRPGENGVTEMDIKMLHSFDDSEIYYNLKECHNRGIEIDALIDTDASNNTSVLSLSSVLFNEPVEDAQRELVREIVATLSNEQQELYRLLYIEEYSLTEIARMYSVSPSAIKQRSQTLMRKIKEKIFQP